MKHSIRYIQFNYNSKGFGVSILVIRGMEIRQYKYSVDRFDTLLTATHGTFERVSRNEYISFSRIYPQ